MIHVHWTSAPIGSPVVGQSTFMPVLQQRAVRCHCQAPIWLNMWKIKEISKNRLDSFGIENWTPQKHLVTRYNLIITSSFVDMTQHVEATTLGMTKPRWHQILEWMCSAAYSILYWFNCKRQHKQANGLRFLLESNTNPFSVLLVVLVLAMKQPGVKYPLRHASQDGNTGHIRLYYFLIIILYRITKWREQIT